MEYFVKVKNFQKNLIWAKGIQNIFFFLAFNDTLNIPNAFQFLKDNNKILHAQYSPKERQTDRERDAHTK